VEPGASQDPCTRSDPLVISLKFQANLIVKDSQITVPAARDRIGHNRLHLLSDNPDVGSFAAIINEAIEAKAVVEMPEQGDTVLKPKIGPASATT
jgi:hypothetical protein